MKQIKLLSLFIAVLFFFTACEQKIKVACVGDSITEGVGTKVWNQSSYPMVLNNLLGENYRVMNCGRSAATMLKKSDFSYWNCNELNDVFLFQPEIITIKLGTNDSKDHNWNAAEYENDYQAMIDTFKTIPGNPQIYMCLPVPAFDKKWGINDTTIREQVIPILKKLAVKNNLPVVDAYTKLTGQGASFPDAIHPNEAGAAKIAEAIAEVIMK